MNIHAQLPPKRIPPNNVEVEQAMLGAILVNNEAYRVVSGMLRAEHFHEPLHRDIFTAVEILIADEKRATPALLQNIRPADTMIGDMTFRAYLARLAAEAVTVVNAPDYAAALIDLADRRAIIAITDDAANIAYDPPLGTSVADQLSDLEQRLIALRAGSLAVERTDASIGSIADDIVTAAEDVDRSAADQATPTGFASLDRRISGGYRAGRLYVIAGRPGMGKSVFGVASARRVARKGAGAAFFSLELDRNEVGARVMASELSMASHPITYADILAANVGESGREQLRWARANLATAPLHIDAAGGLTMHEIEARTRLTRDRFERAGTPLRVVFIDYLGLVKATDRYRGNKVHEMGEMALHAKTMAKRLGVAVVLLAQLSRSVESRDVKRPFMSDLRDSGNIEEHADVVGLLYRPAYYLAQDPRVKAGDEAALIELEDCKHTLDLDLGKNRLGPTMTVKLWADVALSAVNDRQD